MKANGAANTTTEFWVLDLDRTLFDVKQHAEQFYDIGESLGLISKRDLRDHQAVIERDGGSFDPYDFIVASYGLDTWEQLASEYIRRVDSASLLLPGAIDLLTHLDERAIPYAIVTYGGQQWQQCKLDAAGLAMIPSKIINTPVKANVVKTWLDEAGNYRIPTELIDTAKFSALTVESVVIVDDKSLAFAGLPPYSRGYRVKTGLDTSDIAHHFVTSIEDLPSLVVLLENNNH